jgi:hypothetical protein
MSSWQGALQLVPLLLAGELSHAIDLDSHIFGLISLPLVFLPLFASSPDRFRVSRTFGLLPLPLVYLPLVAAAAT